VGDLGDPLRDAEVSELAAGQLEPLRLHVVFALSEVGMAPVLQILQTL